MSRLRTAIVLVSLSFALAPSGAADSWRAGRSFAEIEVLLATPEHRFERTVPMHEWLAARGIQVRGRSSIEVIEFDDFRGVFKPRQDRRRIQADIGAYRLSEHLGLAIVPPVVSRTIGGRRGSFHYYVESPYDLKSSADRDEVARHISAKHLSDVRLFVFIFCQSDPNFGNVMSDAAFNLALIDNDAMRQRCYARYREFPYVLKHDTDEFDQSYEGEPFPFDETISLTSPSLEALRAAFSPYMADDDIEWHHRTWAGRFPDGTTRYVVWRNGVWVRWERLGFFHSRPEVFSRQTLQVLRALEFQHLRRLLDIDTFSEEHILGFLARRDQVLEAARTGTLVD